MKWIAVAACVIGGCWLSINGNSKDGGLVLMIGLMIAVFAN